jgi:hypothetical protein
LRERELRTTPRVVNAVHLQLDAAGAELAYRERRVDHFGSVAGPKAQKALADVVETACA